MESRTGPGELPAEERTLLDVLGVYDDDLKEQFEQLEANSAEKDDARELYRQAEEAYEKSKRYKKDGGCFGPGTLIYEDRELGIAKNEANNKWHELMDKEYDTKNELAHNILSGSDESSQDFRKVAVVQSLFQASSFERVEYAERFLQTLNELDAALQEGEPIYIKSESHTAGYYRVLKSGAKASIEYVGQSKFTEKGYPRAFVRTGRLIGTEVITTSSGSKLNDDEEYEDGLKLYGTKPNSNDAEALEVLEGKLEDRQHPRNLRYAVGATIREPITHAESPAQATALALAGRLRGAWAEKIISYVESSKYKDEMTRMVIEAMTAQITGKVVSKPKYIGSFHNVTWLPIATDIDQAHPRMLVDLIELLKMDKHVIESTLRDNLNGLEAAILEGKELSSRWPEVVVGKIRQDDYIKAVLGL